MIHPASDKVVALSVKAGEALVQGNVLRFLDDGDGQMLAMKATATTDVSNTGLFLAYYITPDSEDVEFTGAPQSSTFTLNSDTGVGGGTNVIPSGSDCVALGGHAALIRMDKNALYDTPSALTDYAPSTLLKVHSDGFLALDADDDLDVVAARVVQNDGVTIVIATV